MKFKGIILLLIFILIQISCKKEIKIPVNLPVFQIDSELKVYFKSFITEAKLRNRTIDTTNLILSINNQSITEKCGTCTQNPKQVLTQKKIEIFTNSGLCWRAASNNAREALVFHELGHCLLGRINHKDDLFKDGSPKSIMITSNIDLYSPCVYVLDDNPASCNKTERRKYYIDELFDPNTPTPAWAK